MFAKLKGSSATPNVLESNPIWTHFEVGKQSATAGPENVWRILEGYRKCDGKEVSIFLFEKRSVEKLHKPKRKEIVTDALRNGVHDLEHFRHPKILQVLHPVEECPETLAFVSEPVLASLANVLAYMEQKAANSLSSPATVMQHNTLQHGNQAGRPVYVKEYDLLDMEIKYGILQIIEALTFLHVTGKCFHRNVCPSSIIITKKSTWKLFGFEFIVKLRNTIDPIPLPQWTSRVSKMTQPSLDYIAPEIQQNKQGSAYSDMFSLGMVICAIFNNGRPLIQANHSCSEYLRQLDMLEDNVNNLLPRVPLPLQEAISKLLLKDPKQRPNASVLPLLKYFTDPAVHALQFLDVISMKNPREKSHFYTSTLKEALPYIPRKLWYQHVWPCLQAETNLQEAFASALQPMLYIIQNSTIDDYERIILPSFKEIFSLPKTTQGTVGLLENLHIILEKTHRADIRANMLQLLYTSFDSSTMQVKTAAFAAVENVTDYLDDVTIRRKVLPKLKSAFNDKSTSPKILMNALSRIFDRLEKQQIIDDVLPLLWQLKLQDPEILMRVVSLYRLMLNDKKYGLSVNLMATHVMPSLLPETVNTSLKRDQFNMLLKVLHEMLGHIERYQRNNLQQDNLSLSSPERHRTLQYQYSTENVHVQQFNIPNLRLSQRKTSSAEDVEKKTTIGSISMTASAENMNSRKNSMGVLGSWLFGSTSSANESSNFLRVANTMTCRRLSDNTLMAPKIRVPPSCASSPGGTPGSGLPTRRHSSTGPQDRRGSSMNLSPPTGMPITSNSVPYLLSSSSLNSVRNSRRPSISSTSSQQGSGLLQQFGSGMYQLFSGRS